MRDRGVEFLYVPENYYDDLLERVGEIDEDVEVLKQHGILIDRDDEGTFYSCLRSLFWTDQPCSLKSFSVKEHSPLEKEILKRFLKRLKGTRK